MSAIRVGCVRRRRSAAAAATGCGSRRQWTRAGAGLDPVPLAAGTGSRAGARGAGRRRRSGRGRRRRRRPTPGRTPAALYAVSSISWLGWRSAGIAATGLTAWRRAYDDSEWPGPSSTSDQRAVGQHRRRQSAKRTVWRRWSTQYCGSVACSAVIHVPVRFERYGTCGGEQLDRRTTSRNSGRIGSSSELCAAAASGISVGVDLVGGRAALGEGVDVVGRTGDDALVVGVDRGQRQRRRRAAARTSASGSGTASIAAPTPLTRSISLAAGDDQVERVRRATSTPARWAATYSPRLWPTNAVGVDAPGHPLAGEGDRREEHRRQRRRRLAQRVGVGVGPQQRGEVDARALADPLDAVAHRPRGRRRSGRRGRRPSRCTASRRRGT